MPALRNPHPKRLEPPGALYPHAESVMSKRREISPSLQPALDSCWLAAPAERSPRNSEAGGVRIHPDAGGEFVPGRAEVALFVGIFDDEEGDLDLTDQATLTLA